MIHAIEDNAGCIWIHWGDYAVDVTWALDDSDETLEEQMLTLRDGQWDLHVCEGYERPWGDRWYYYDEAGDPTGDSVEAAMFARRGFLRLDGDGFERDEDRDPRRHSWYTIPELPEVSAIEMPDAPTIEDRQVHDGDYSFGIVWGQYGRMSDSDGVKIGTLHVFETEEDRDEWARGGYGGIPSEGPVRECLGAEDGLVNRARRRMMETAKVGHIPLHWEDDEDEPWVYHPA